MIPLRKPLEDLSVTLAIGVLVLLGLNFTLSHDLESASRGRFLLSGTLLALVTLYFRFGVSRVEDLHRAAYRVAATITFWSFGFAVFPRPELFLYLVILPGVFFLLRAEAKALGGRGSEEDVVAAGILLALGALLYFEQKPIRTVFYPDAEAAASWFEYYLGNAPVMALIGAGLVRLRRHGGFAGFVVLGTLFVVLSLVLTGLLLSPVPSALGVPVVLLHVVFWVHAVLLLSFAGGPLGEAFDAFAGLAGDERRRFRVQVYWLGNAALHGVAVAAAWVGEGLLALAVVLLALAGSLYHHRRRSIAVFLMEVAAIAYPLCRLLYDLPPVFLTAALAVVLGLAVAVRRARRLHGAMPDWAYLFCALLYLASVVDGGVFRPLGLGFLVILAASWGALPDRPGRLEAARWVWAWPPIVLVVLLCLFRGEIAAVLPVWALLTLALPLLAWAVLARPAFAAQRRRWSTLGNWLSVAPRDLHALSFFAVAVCAAAFALDYGAFVDGWGGLGLVFATLASSFTVHLVATLRRTSVGAAAWAEVHVWLVLGLLRWKMEVLDRLELGSPVDGYVLLGAAFVAAGLREVIRRRTEVFSPLLLWSSTVYGLLGWAYMLWLAFTDSGGYHGEVGSLLMAGLYYWFSLTRRKTNVIPAFVFANLASALFLFRQGFVNAQLYVLPAGASVLVVAQLFKDRLTPERRQAIRLWTSLAILGTSSFYNVADLEGLAYPLAAALLSALLIVVGIALRIRIYLFLGFGSFVFNTLTVLVDVVRVQPPSQVKLIVGFVFLAVGVLFTGSFLLLQMKRQEILNRVARLKEELGSWE